MESMEIQNKIEQYLENVKSLLPEGINRKEIIDELRVHINDAFSDKLEQSPSENPSSLLNDVLSNLGSPEEIASEYKRSISEEDVSTARKKRMLYMVGRLVIALIVITLVSAWFADTMPQGLDFWTYFVILLTFAVAEWLVELYQGGMRGVRKEGQ